MECQMKWSPAEHAGNSHQIPWQTHPGKYPLILIIIEKSITSYNAD